MTTTRDRWLMRLGLVMIAAALTMLLFSACASAPTAPTPAPTVATALSPYRWDIVAPGCAPPLPLPALTGVAPTRELLDLTVTPPRLTLFYAQGAPRANGDQDFIVGQFVRLDKVWAVCSWALMTRGVDQ